MQNATYKHPIDIRNEHIDSLGHVNNVVYLQWVQETAAAHWRHATTPAEQQQYRWVVLRHEIDYIKPVLADDQICGHTWVDRMDGVKSHRRVEIMRANETVAKALTVWVMISAKDGRPQRIPDELAAKFLCWAT